MMYIMEYIFPLEEEIQGCKQATVTLACNTKLGNKLLWKICQSLLVVKGLKMQKLPSDIAILQWQTCLTSRRIPVTVFVLLCMYDVAN